MGSMIAAELFKLRKRPMTWWMLGIMAAITTLVFTVNYQIGHHSSNATTARNALDNARLPNGAHTAVSAATALWGTLTVIAIAVVVGNEFQYGTLRTQLAMGLRRIPYVLSKVIAVFVAAIIGLFIIVAFGVGLSLLLTAVDGAPMTWSGAFGQQFWQTLGVDLLSTATRFTLALFITLLARQVVAGVAVVLGYTILEGTITSLLTSFGGGWAKAVNFFLTPNQRAIAYGLDRSERFNQALFSVPVAITILVGYAIIFLIASIVIFNQRDVKGAA
ncbi:MAG: ABC transporter permease [Thermomicrobia bacterium]|nr:ABC transporter permease [Thermomicrobia bacterium]